MKKWSRIIHILKNKYILTLIIFGVWILLFDSNNLIDRFAQLKTLKQLEKDREYYMERIEEDSRKLNELETDKENLEKFAREQYLMKKENEEIFVVIDEEEEKEKWVVISDGQTIVIRSATVAPLSYDCNSIVTR